MEVLEKHDELYREAPHYLLSVEKQLHRASKFFEDVEAIKQWAPTVQERIKEQEPRSKEPEDLRTVLRRIEVRTSKEKKFINRD